MVEFEIDGKTKESRKLNWNENGSLCYCWVTLTLIAAFIIASLALDIHHHEQFWVKCSPKFATSNGANNSWKSVCCKVSTKTQLARFAKLVRLHSTAFVSMVLWVAVVRISSSNHCLSRLIYLLVGKERLRVGARKMIIFHGSTWIPVLVWNTSSFLMLLLLLLPLEQEVKVMVETSNWSSNTHMNNKIWFRYKYSSVSSALE